MPSANLDPEFQAELDAIAVPANTPNTHDPSPSEPTSEVKGEPSVKDELKIESEDERLKEELHTAAAELEVKDSPIQEDAAVESREGAPAEQQEEEIAETFF